MKIQEKKQISGKKKTGTLEPRSTDSSSVSREEGKRGANEPLYLLRYE